MIGQKMKKTAVGFLHLITALLFLQLQVTSSREQVGPRLPNEDLATPLHPGHTPSLPGTVSSEAANETFMDSLVWEGRDMTATFVLEVLQGLHMQSITCSMNMSAVEMKHVKELETMLKYYHSMEKLVSNKQYMQISQNDRPVVEGNFHNTMRHHEKTRNLKLQKIKAQCDSQQQKWLRQKFSTIVTHARTLLDTGRREQYQTMEGRLHFCRQKIQQHLSTCRTNSNSFGLLYCYVDELDVLLRKIDELLATMQEMMQVYYGDDEDLVTTTGSGNGLGGAGMTNAPETMTDSTDDEDGDQGIAIPIDPAPEDTTESEDTTDPVDTTDPPTSKVVTDSIAVSTELHSATPTIVHKMALPQDFFGKAPVILDPHQVTSKTTPKTTPTPAETTQDEVVEEDLTPPRIREDLTPIINKTSPSSVAERLVTGSPAIAGGEDTEGDSTQMPPAPSTSQAGTAPDWLEPASEQVLEGRENKTGRESSKSSSRSSSQSGSRKASKSLSPQRASLEVDIDGSEGDVEIDVSFNGPVVDPGQDSPSTEGEGRDENQEKWSYTTYILIYFFLTLGLIILVFVTVIIAMVTVWKTKNARRRPSAKDPPLITDKEMLDVMKKTGYVNPTYKFYSQT